MTLKPAPDGPIPHPTTYVARAAFPKGNPNHRLRDELGAIFCDGDFADLFPRRGQPAPGSLAARPDHPDADLRGPPGPAPEDPDRGGVRGPARDAGIHGQRGDVGWPRGVRGSRAISKGVRAFGLRRARCRGLAKAHLQHVATAVALNLSRISDWLGGVHRMATRVSQFSRLAA